MDFRFKGNKLSKLRLSHPKLWRFLILNKGLGKRIIALKRAFKSNVPEESDAVVNFLVELWPSFFDSI